MRVGMQRVIVNMSDELVAAVDEAAKEEDRTRSWMIRHALELSFLAVRPPPLQGLSAAALVAVSDGHGFVPQQRNKLRCELCGQRRSAHLVKQEARA
jgi:hypothetical protein